MITKQYRGFKLKLEQDVYSGMWRFTSAANDVHGVLSDPVEKGSYFTYDAAYEAGEKLVDGFHRDLSQLGSPNNTLRVSDKVQITRSSSVSHRLIGRLPITGTVTEIDEDRVEGGWSRPICITFDKDGYVGWWARWEIGRTI